MNAPTVTLKELAAFLLSLHPEDSINMISGSPKDSLGGCLMAKYGVHMNWTFDDCAASEGWFRGKFSASIESGVFNIFQGTPPLNELRIVKGWQKQIKPEYLH
jgi:hypothetical protein